MSARPQWSYVQARLQARHGERLQEADWRTLEGARSIDQFLERAAATPLHRFTGRLNARMSSHAIERVLRGGWRAYVAEVASWIPVEWRLAVVWTSYLPDLPLVDALLRDAVPKWLQLDSSFAEFIESDPRRRSAALAQSPLAPLALSATQDTALAARWTAHWRALWPEGAAGDPALRDFAAAIGAHVARLDRAGPQEASAPYRHDLTQGITRLFRRQSATPAAVFCHLALVAIDLERLRGGLVRRRLFEQGHAKDAA